MPCEFQGQGHKRAAAVSSLIHQVKKVQAPCRKGQWADRPWRMNRGLSISANQLRGDTNSLIFWTLWCQRWPLQAGPADGTWAERSHLGWKNSKMAHLYAPKFGVVYYTAVRQSVPLLVQSEPLVCCWDRSDFLRSHYPVSPLAPSTGLVMCCSLLPKKSPFRNNTILKKPSMSVLPHTNNHLKAHTHFALFLSFIQFYHLVYAFIFLQKAMTFKVINICLPQFWSQSWCIWLW